MAYPLSSHVRSHLSKLNLKYPIIQAPMAGVSTPQLASTLSNAGALGSIGLGASTPTSARQMIHDTQKLLRSRNTPYNVNLFVHSHPTPNTQVNTKWLEILRPHFDKYRDGDVSEVPKELRVIYKSFVYDNSEMVDLLLDTKPPIISFHFGLPSLDVLKELKQNGSILMATATSLEEARIIENAQMIDYIVAQGYEAGGHRGIFNPSGLDEKLSTFVLTSLLLERCATPIIAAGGIMHGSHIKAYLDLGVVAVQLGTAFIGCPESSADAGYKAALFSQKSERTKMTRVISGRPARSLVNRFTELEDELEGEVEVPDYPLTYDAGKALHALAKARGEHGYGAQWAGQGASLAREMGARELLERLVEEAGLGS
ncbi:hypothetical protein I302_109076 [Kwoniella bestiolae CBS 10118]|uniref:Uncharacterized protein n=1 Tax=Kwoniella bestiolae CBS 10118 TaxID=1296100 RepID=A0A1B9FUW7_9TREE|nr:hypothetical protein I302_08220 [Kwoniella bestiolae CBS 10118]OCF22570.1 hypothetical protein I302_08220 [Kwoniella bestiolae CBS 10118]